MSTEVPNNIKKIDIDDLYNPTKVYVNNKEAVLDDPFTKDVKFQQIEVDPLLIMKAKPGQGPEGESEAAFRCYWICIGGKYFRVCL